MGRYSATERRYGKTDSRRYLSRHLDPRILRHPDRIERVLQNVLELRSTGFPGRRTGLSQWEEAGRLLYGKVILEDDGGVRSMHIIDARTMRKEQRKGVLLWKL